MRKDALIPARWKPGDVIGGRWRVFDTAAGPYGTVYAVFDAETGEVLAAKTFSDALLRWDRILVHRLKKGALSWMKLGRHRNLVRPRFLHSVDGCLLLFMEYVCGTHLGQWIGPQGVTGGPVAVLRLALQLCDGLEFAESNGIGGHCDIRPENCLVTGQGILKVTDPGLARAFDESLVAAAVDARSGTRVRTRGDLIELVHGHGPEAVHSGVRAAAYLAPEQFSGSKHVDRRADIYAFGVLLYQMIAGRLPFTASTWADYEMAHRNLEPPALPPEQAPFFEVVQTCLAKEAPRRFTDFSALRRYLAQLYRTLAGRTFPPPVDGDELEAEDCDGQGLGLLQFGYPEEALAAFEQALELNPDHAVLWAHKGEALRQLGQNEDALICHQVSLELDSNCAAAWYHRGLALRALDRIGEAHESHERAIELDPYVMAGMAEQPAGASRTPVWNR